MATEDARKLFVAGLPDSITEDVLRQLFEATGGKVVDLSLPRDRLTGRPRGFGFVTFATADEATAARGKLDGSLQAGRPMSVRPFSSEPPRRGDATGSQPPAAAPAEDRTLYVGNLPYDTSQQELTQLFADAGVSQVARIHLPVGPDGRLRGFGFVTMASADAANGALAALRTFEVRGRRVMINIAHPRGAPGAPGGGGDRPRPPGGGGGYSSDFRSSGFGPPPPPPDFAFGGKPLEGRRARGAQITAPTGEWAEGSDAKKRKKGARRKSDRGGEEKKAGRTDDWQDWDEDLKDDKEE